MFAVAIHSQPGVPTFSIPIHIIQREPSECTVGVVFLRLSVPPDLSPEGLETLFAQLDLAITRPASPQIFHVVSRQFELTEIIQHGGIADLFGDSEWPALFEALDIPDTIDVGTRRCIDPDRSEDRDFLACVGRKHPGNGIARKEARPLAGRWVYLSGEVGFETCW